MDQDQATIDRIYEPVKEQLVLVEKRLHGLDTRDHAELAKLLGHVATSPGKRIRPAITLLSSRLYPNGQELPIIMATAVELLHMASLLHDDTVDNASTRRGAATVSSVWGHNVAVMSGDYLFGASAIDVADIKNVKITELFSRTIMGLAAGQLMEALSAFKLDLTYEQYKERIANKTAWLFRGSAESGAILSHAPEADIQSLSEYGYDLGMAFQIVDDILDFEGTEDEVGKPVGRDLLNGVLTLPAIFLIQRYPDENPIVSLFKGEEPEAECQRAVEMIRNSSIIQDSYAVALQFCSSAINAVKKLPNTQERKSLLDIVSYVVERRR